MTAVLMCTQLLSLLFCVFLAVTLVVKIKGKWAACLSHMITKGFYQQCFTF